MSLIEIVNDYEQEKNRGYGKLRPLQEMDVFVLDNSLRESTVAQLRGHTLENKPKIYNEVKKCGFKNAIVASYGHNVRVDDIWVENLLASGEDPSGLFAFTEMTSGVKNKIPSTEGVPIGLTKMKAAGLRNPIFEIDLSDEVYDFQQFPLEDLLALLRKQIEWAHANLHKDAKVLVNLRDIGAVISHCSPRVFLTVDYIAKLPANIRPSGLIFEEVSGLIMPEEVGNWARHLRMVMELNGWRAHLLIHVHEKYGFRAASQIQGLMNGANGVWASVCSEGAALGHASSAITLMNMIRLGNTRVPKQYNCQYLRKAAANITQITTGLPPHPKHPIYGARALDFVFSINEVEFDLAEFFEEEAPLRMSTLASHEMIRDNLVRYFGEDDQFTLDIAEAMKNTMIADLTNQRKEEYMSPAGLAVLFDRSGGKMTEAMGEVVAEMKVRTPHAEALINEVRTEIWDVWDQKEELKGDDMLSFDSFYDGFMAPYFSCYNCPSTKRALSAIDMDSDGMVDWNEFLVYLKWATRQYPALEDTDALLECVFIKGIIPAMRDGLKNRPHVNIKE